MASIHTTNPLTTHTYTGTSDLLPGSLIKLRFGDKLPGPCTMPAVKIVTTMTSTTRAPYHSALVLCVSEAGGVLDIDYLPMVSYHRSGDPVSPVANSKESERLIHLPVPSTATLPTPFMAADYISDRPCWLQVARVQLGLTIGHKVI